MTKKLVSFIILVALCTTSVFMANAGVTHNTSYEYKSNFVSQVNNHDSLAQSGQQASVVSKVSALTSNSQRDIQYPSDNSNFTENQQTYKPGDWVNITSNVGYNGSLNWAISSPNANDKPVFSPTKNATDIFFKDPAIANATQSVDWHNHGFTSVTGAGQLNLTYNGAGPGATLSYHQYNDIKGRFEVKFQYLKNTTDTSNLTLDYFDGSSIQHMQLNYTSSSNPSLVSFDQVLTIDTTNPNYYSALNLTLQSSSTPSMWIIKPIYIYYDEANIPFTDNAVHTGSLQQVWVHGSQNVQRDIINVYYFVNQSTTENSYDLVSFNFTLPKLQVYIGEWQFALSITPIDSKAAPLTGAEVTIKVPFVVQYNLYFQMMRQYVYRGTNTTDSSAIYKDETNTTSVFSPTDKIIYIGQIYTNVTNTRDNLDSSYFTTVTGLLNSSTVIMGSNDYSWTNSGFSSYKLNNTYLNTAKTRSIENQLPASLQNNYTWIIENTIPNRGIYGTVNQTLNLDFPTALSPVNASTGSTYFNTANSNITLNQATVKFNLNITNYNTPFPRTWFLTEFMEGNFSVSTWRYNTTGIEATNNVTGQDFSLQLNIPLTDLAFSVFLQDNVTGTLDQTMQVELLNNTSTFYFAGSISANLNTQHLYHLGVNWLNPKYSAEKSAHEIPFLNYAALYNIKGTLTVQVPLSVLQFRQGDNFVVKFNVTIDQLNGKPAAGLNLNAVIENGTSLAPLNTFSPQITEADGVFTVFMTLHYDSPLGNYVCQIFKTSTNTPIGSFQFQILPAPVNSQDITTVIPFVYSFFGAVLGIIVLLGFVVMFLKFKK